MRQKIVPLTDWLEVMLGEVRRKKEERAQLAEDAVDRGSNPDGLPAQAATEADSAGKQD
jgi:hypothetical protein